MAVVYDVVMPAEEPNAVNIVSQKVGKSLMEYSGFLRTQRHPSVTGLSLYNQAKRYTNCAAVAVYALFLPDRPMYSTRERIP